MQMQWHFIAIGAVLALISSVQLIRVYASNSKEAGVGWLMSLACALLIIALSGCAAIDYNKTPANDWPIKQINIYVVDHEVMADICQCYSPPLMVAQACTLLYFNQGKAEIWLARDTAEWVIEHEKEHAFDGRDHLLSEDIAQALHAWRNGGGINNNCSMPERMNEYRKLPFTVEYSYERKKRHPPGPTTSHN